MGVPLWSMDDAFHTQYNLHPSGKFDLPSQVHPDQPLDLKMLSRCLHIGVTVIPSSTRHGVGWAQTQAVGGTSTNFPACFCTVQAPQPATNVQDANKLVRGTLLVGLCLLLHLGTMA